MLLNIICERVIKNSIIHTDEYCSYNVPVKNGHINLCFCHKYEYKSNETGAHTQHVESFNNCVKSFIKKEWWFPLKIE